MRQYKSTFDVLDENNDGLVNCKQLIDIISQIQIENQNNLTYKYIIRLAEEDPKMMIDFQKFVSIMQGELGDFSTKQGLMKIFNLFDKGTGKIDKE